MQSNVINHALHLASFWMGITDTEFVRIPVFKRLADLTGDTDADRDTIKFTICHKDGDINDNLVRKFHKFKEHFRFGAIKEKLKCPEFSQLI